DHLRGDLRDDLRDDWVDLAWHDRAPFLELRQHDLAEAGTRPGAEQAKVVCDLRQRNGHRLERARGLDQGVARGLGLEGVGWRADAERGFVGQPRANPRGKLRMGVQAGAHGGAAERDLPDALERGADAIRPLANL